MTRPPVPLCGSCWRDPIVCVLLSPAHFTARDAARLPCTPGHSFTRTPVPLSRRGRVSAHLCIFLPQVLGWPPPWGPRTEALGGSHIIHDRCVADLTQPQSPTRLPPLPCRPLGLGPPQGLWGGGSRGRPPVTPGPSGSGGPGAGGPAPPPLKLHPCSSPCRGCSQGRRSGRKAGLGRRLRQVVGCEVPGALLAAGAAEVQDSPGTAQAQAAHSSCLPRSPVLTPGAAH